jgi:small subunit ribosomal protein S23e
LRRLGASRCADAAAASALAPRSKTRGLGAGRKLKTRRREQRWHDKGYCRAHLGSEWKKPFAGTSHSKGIVLEKMCVPALRQPPAGARRRAGEPRRTP